MSRLAAICLPALAVLVVGGALGLGGARGAESPVATVSGPIRPWPLEVPVRPSPQRDLGMRAAELAPRLVGAPYHYGGTSPRSGFDCSGFTRYVYGELGVQLPHNAAAQYALGRAVPRSRLRPGDLVFFEGLGHVGLYLGHGNMIHAPHSGDRVEVVRLAGHYDERLIGARRLVVS